MAGIAKSAPQVTGTGATRTNVVGDFASQAAGLAVRLLYTLVCLLFVVLQEFTVRIASFFRSLSNARASGDPGADGVPKVKAFEMSACDHLHEDHFDDRELRLLCMVVESDVSAAADALTNAVDELLSSTGNFGKVSFSLQAVGPPRVALLGTSAVVRSTGDSLHFRIPFSVREVDPEKRFLISLSLRDSWEMPQDDALADASIGSEWCDLGDASAGEKVSAASLQARKVLHSRLMSLMPSSEEVYVFVDESPQNGNSILQIAGALNAESWAAATKLVLSCEAGGVYLSRSYGAMLWPGSGERRAVEEQLHYAVSASGSEASTSPSPSTQGLILQAASIECFEDLADNIAAVIRGEQPPGWHRLAWTPNVEGAVSHLTY